MAITRIPEFAGMQAVPDTVESTVQTSPDGTVRWMTAEGHLHRPDGPAVENADGSQEWHILGVLHRSDGPARVSARGDEEWWQGGLLHRDDGPACVWLPGRRPGKWSRSPRDARGDDWGRCGYPLKTKVPHVRPVREWFQFGLRHRTDGPAVEGAGDAAEWHQFGLAHRENGPAAIFADGGREWLQFGYHHRLDGPAIEDADGRRVWARHGQPHRADEPAIIHADGTPEWFWHGRPVAQEDANDATPAPHAPWFGRIEGLEPPRTEDVYYGTGPVKHRDDGPAVVGTGGLDGSETWLQFGWRHRTDGPANTSDRGDREWCVFGLRHRTDGPAYIRYDGLEEWWLFGVWHRTDGPAFIRGAGRPTEARSWRQFGRLHRVDGPAVEDPRKPLYARFGAYRSTPFTSADVGDG